MSPPVGESSLNVISFIDKSGSPSSAKTSIAEKGNINMANKRAVSLRVMVVPNTANLPDYKRCVYSLREYFLCFNWLSSSRVVTSLSFQLCPILGKYMQSLPVILSGTKVISMISALSMASS